MVALPAWLGLVGCAAQRVRAADQSDLCLAQATCRAVFRFCWSGAASAGASDIPGADSELGYGIIGVSRSSGMAGRCLRSDGRRRADDAHSFLANAIDLGAGCTCLAARTRPLAECARALGSRLFDDQCTRQRCGW